MGWPECTRKYDIVQHCLSVCLVTQLSSVPNYFPWASQVSRDLGDGLNRVWLTCFKIKKPTMYVQIGLKLGMSCLHLELAKFLTILKFIQWFISC